MKHLLLTTIAAVVLVVGCGESQQSSGTVIKLKNTLSEADSALLKDAKTGNIEVVKQHLVNGADVNAKDWGGYTPLHMAVQNLNIEIAKLLIANGSNVNAITKFGKNTPLFYAVQKRSHEMVKILLDAGAKPNTSFNHNGKLPLHFAIAI